MSSLLCSLSDSEIEANTSSNPTLAPGKFFGRLLVIVARVVVDFHG